MFENDILLDKFVPGIVTMDVTALGVAAMAVEIADDAPEDTVLSCESSSHPVVVPLSISLLYNLFFAVLYHSSPA